MLLRSLCATAIGLVMSTSAGAAQFSASTTSIFDGSAYGSSYSGPGGTTSLFNQPLGEVVDGGNGAFDAYGFYNAGVGGLTQTRKVDLLSGNVFRFFDTFTNKTGATVSTTLNFFGNLGSDGSELVKYSQGGLVVSCQDDGTGTCSSEPVIALVSGNNGLGQAAITPDRYNSRFALTVAANQSVSLLNFAFLASDAAGTTEQDVSLGISTGLSLLSAPRTDGLSSAELAGIANYNAIPEPASAALLIAAMAMMRRKRRAVTAW